VNYVHEAGSPIDAHCSLAIQAIAHRRRILIEPLRDSNCVTVHLFDIRDDISRDTINFGNIVMFDKFTERARRVIFYARFAASELGCPEIDTDLLLLGILREYPSVLESLGAAPGITDDIKAEVRARHAGGKKIPTNVDLPLSDEAKRVLQSAMDKMIRLNHPNIQVHHLVLGILSEEQGFAAQILMKSGVVQADTKQKLSDLGSVPEPNVPPPSGNFDVV
jgi:hypothetical protein